jgi:hypothetical protein
MILHESRSVAGENCIFVFLFQVFSWHWMCFLALYSEYFRISVIMQWE